MKAKNRLLFPSLLIVSFASLPGIASAVDGIKDDNTLALNDPLSWVGSAPPSGPGAMIVDATLANDRTAALGDDLTVTGITYSSSKILTIGNTATKALTIGSSGITMTGGRLNFSNAVSLGANQTWSLGSKRINVNNTLTTGGNTLSVTGTSGSVFKFEGNNTNTIGTGVTISAYDFWLDGGTTTIDGTNNTNSVFSLFSGTANIAAMGNLTGASSIGTGSAYVRGGATLNYTGNSFSSNKGFTRDNVSANTNSTIKVTTSGETLSMSGNLTSTGGGTGGWVFGGAGNLTLSGNINNSGTQTVTKIDAGTLTLSGANTYVGATSVTGGTLALVGGSQSSPITISSGATLGFTLGSPTTSTSTVTFSGATPKVTVSGTPAAATLMTASGITGIPVLDPAIPSYFLAVTATGLDLVTTAGQGIKADNTDALNLTTSWVGGTKPTAGTYMMVDTTMTDHRTSALGDDLSVLGITASSAKTLTISDTAGKTLSIGTSGISKSSGAGELVFNNATSLAGNISMPNTSTGRMTFGGALTLTANQTWNSGINRINVNNTLTTGGNNLSITGGAGSTIRFGASNTLGSEVTISNAGNFWVDMGGAGTLTINGTNNTNTDVSLFSGTLNIASMGNGGEASSIGKGTLYMRAQSTLNYTGNTASSNKGMFRDTNSGGTLGNTTFNVTTAGQTLTMSGNFGHFGTTQTGAWIFGGAGNLTLTGAILNGVSTPVIKNGTGTLTLSGANTYAGATTVNAGTLALGANDVLPDTDISIGAATLAATSDDTAGALDVTAAATIHLGAGANLVFANSSGKTWAGTLNITGTFVPGSSLYFGAGGLTTEQLLKISAPGFSDFALVDGFLTATETGGYSSWASLNGAGLNLSDDHDNDGVDNGTEYFLGGPNGPTTGFTPLPGVTNNLGILSITWIKGAGYIGAYNTDFVVETSTTLSGTWTVEASPGNVADSPTSVTYTFPGGPAYSGKRFARLKVTGP